MRSVKFSDLETSRRQQLAETKIISTTRTRRTCASTYSRRSAASRSRTCRKTAQFIPRRTRSYSCHNLNSWCVRKRSGMMLRTFIWESCNSASASTWPCGSTTQCTTSGTTSHRSTNNWFRLQVIVISRDWFSSSTQPSHGPTSTRYFLRRRSWLAKRSTWYRTRVEWTRTKSSGKTYRQ